MEEGEVSFSSSGETANESVDLRLRLVPLPPATGSPNSPKLPRPLASSSGKVVSTGASGSIREKISTLSQHRLSQEQERDFSASPSSTSTPSPPLPDPEARARLQTRIRGLSQQLPNHPIFSPYAAEGSKTAEDVEQTKTKKKPTKSRSFRLTPSSIPLGLASKKRSASLKTIPTSTSSTSLSSAPSPLSSSSSLSTTSSASPSPSPNNVPFASMTTGSSGGTTITTTSRPSRTIQLSSPFASRPSQASSTADAFSPPPSFSSSSILLTIDVPSLDFAWTNNKLRFRSSCPVSSAKEVIESRLRENSAASNNNRLYNNHLGNASSMLDGLSMFYPQLGIWLEDDRTLGEYFLKNGDRIEMRQRPSSNFFVVHILVEASAIEEEVLCCRETTVRGVMHLLQHHDAATINEPADISNFGLVRNGTWLEDHVLVSGLGLAEQEILLFRKRYHQKPKKKPPPPPPGVPSPQQPTNNNHGDDSNPQEERPEETATETQNSPKPPPKRTQSMYLPRLSAFSPTVGPRALQPASSPHSRALAGSSSPSPSAMPVASASQAETEQQTEAEATDKESSPSTINRPSQGRLRKRRSSTGGTLRSVLRRATNSNSADASNNNNEANNNNMTSNSANNQKKESKEDTKKKKKSGNKREENKIRTQNKELCTSSSTSPSTSSTPSSSPGGSPRRIGAFKTLSMYLSDKEKPQLEQLQYAISSSASSSPPRSGASSPSFPASASPLESTSSSALVKVMCIEEDFSTLVKVSGTDTAGDLKRRLKKKMRNIDEYDLYIVRNDEMGGEEEPVSGELMEDVEAFQHHSIRSGNVLFLRPNSSRYQHQPKHQTHSSASPLISPTRDASASPTPEDSSTSSHPPLVSSSSPSTESPRGRARGGALPSMEDDGGDEGVGNSGYGKRRAGPSKKIYSSLSHFFKNRPDRGELVERNILSESPVVAESSPALRLPVITALVNYLDSPQALQSEGLFRISGTADTVHKIWSTFHGSDLSLPEGKVHDVAGAFKQYLRESPQPLIPFEFYERFLKAGAIEDHDDRCPVLKRLVEDLPRENRLMLVYLFSLLQKVTQYSEDNKMSSNNLSIVFGPTIMRNMSNTVDYSSTTRQSNVAFSLVEDFDNIFEKLLLEKEAEDSKYQETENAARPAANDVQKELLLDDGEREEYQQLLDGLLSQGKSVAERKDSLSRLVVCLNDAKFKDHLLQSKGTEGVFALCSSIAQHALLLLNNNSQT
ncbi:Rho GTPase-activating protein 12 [Balamuthia mandrillaris]